MLRLCAMLTHIVRHKCAMAHKMRQLINMYIIKRLQFESRLVWIATWNKMPEIV